MITLDSVCKRKNDKWVSRTIFDEVVVMPLCRTEGDISYIYSISNDTAIRMWQLLDGVNSVRGVQESIKREFDGQAEVIERDTFETIKDLFEAGLIEEVKKNAEVIK